MSDTTNSQWQLEASGQSGGIEIDLMSSLGSGETWLCELRMEPVYLTFESAGPVAIRKFADFVDRNIGKRKYEEESIGVFSGCAVSIVKDDEYEDRFFLRARGAGSCFDLTFAGDETIALSAALKSLVAELP